MIKFLDKLKYKKESQKGISLITLVITVIVVIILAGMALSGNLGTIDDAAIAEYRDELKSVEVSVSSKRIYNQQSGIGEELKEKGFYPILIENPPEDFVSFNNAKDVGYNSGDFYGYIVDLKLIDETSTKKGKDYKKYETFDSTKTITFGEKGKNNDVYIYDATGKMYYAKGFYVEDGVYFSDELISEGPIITIEKIPDETLNIVELIIKVKPQKRNANLYVDINGQTLAEEADGTYKYTATKNDLYIITADEENNSKSSKRVSVTEIKEAEYTITYHLLYDGKIETQTKYGKEKVKLLYATRAGYTLKGWCTNSTATTVDYKAGDYYAKNEDIELWAVWKIGEQKTYTIRYNANGGTEAPEPQTKPENVSITLSNQIPKRLGFKFKGWSTTSTGDVEYASGAEFAKEEDTVLYAVWKSGNLEVNLSVAPTADAGNVVGGGAKDAGNIVYVTAIANPGYVFSKWTGDVAITDLDIYSETSKFTMPNTDVNLTANFIRREYDYVIKYNANGGTGVPNTQYKEHDVDIELSKMVPTRSGYKFIGWSDTVAAQKAKYGIAEDTNSYTYSENKNVTLYAVWERNTEEFTLKFNSNGGTGAPKSITKVKDTIITIPLETPVKGNLIFLGWNEDKNAKEATYRKNDSYKIIKDQTLYAIWSDTENPIVNISATEENNDLVLYGNAIDNGGIVSYLWTNTFYEKSQYSNIPWVNLSESRNEISIRKDVINSGIHYFYVVDIDGNISYSSIEIFRMSFMANDVLVDSKFKAASVDASLSDVIPEKAMYVFDRWKAKSDSRIYEKGAKYLLNKNEIFEATWNEAYAYIPSTNKYYLTTQDAINAVPENTSDYVVVRLVRNETTEGVEINNGRKISYETEDKTLKITQNTINVASNSYLKITQGAINSDNYGIRNLGYFEILEGTINAKYGIYNSGSVLIGKENEVFSRDTVKITATEGSYVKGASTATVKFVNGSLTDYRNNATGAIHSVNTDKFTLRSKFEIRKIGDASTDRIITTLVEDLVMTSSVVTGTLEKPVEVKVSLSCDVDSVYTYKIQYSEDNINWVDGTNVNIIDNKMVYGRILEGTEVANTEKLKIDTIVDLIVTFDANQGTVNPSTKAVKYKREYGDLPTPNRTYYDFLGWFTNPTGGTQVTNTTQVNITSNQTLYAHWKGIALNVSFDARNNGTTLISNPSSITVYYNETYGNKLPSVDDSSLTYYFRGWWTSASGGTQVTSTTQVNKTSSHTLYAHWEKKNTEPKISSISMSANTTNSMTLRAVATDSDAGDTLRYRFYFNGGTNPVYTSGYVTPGQAVTYTVSGLSEYSYYNFYVVVDDEDDSVTSSVKNDRTKCSGTGYTDASYCSDYTPVCCPDSNKCSKCGHSHTGTCTTSVTCDECWGSGTISGCPTTQTCSNCGGSGTVYCPKTQKKTVTFTDKNLGLKTCICGADNEYMYYVKCDVCSGGAHFSSCILCENTYGYNMCMNCGTAFEAWGPDFTGVGDCPNGCSRSYEVDYSDENWEAWHQKNCATEETCSICNGTGSKECNSCSNGTVTCGLCNGTGERSCPTTETCGCTHNPATCNKTLKPCGHGYTHAHYYCTKHGYEDGTTKAHCSHGYNSAH